MEETGEMICEKAETALTCYNLRLNTGLVPAKLMLSWLQVWFYFSH